MGIEELRKMGDDLQKRAKIDQLHTALREIAAEAGFTAYLEQDPEVPLRSHLTFEPDPGKERAGEFARKAAERCGFDWRPVISSDPDLD